MLGKLIRDRYQIVQVLNTEGFCHTYLAKDTHQHHPTTCIVKHFQAVSDHPESLATLRGLFIREVEALKKLGDYDRIPQLLCNFEENQEFYLIQEFIAGNPLSTELEPGQKWSESQVIQLLQEVLPILEFIHSHGLIHRNIQPKNIIRRQHDDRLILVDFSSVKQAWTRVVTNQGKTSSNYFLSGPATIAIGTAGYMPTEQAQGKPRPNSDIYALGIIGIQALTGLNPTQFTQNFETGEINWQDHCPQVSPELANVLNNAICYHYRDRYQSATEALQAIQPLVMKQLLSPTVISQKTPTSNSDTTYLDKDLKQQGDKRDLTFPSKSTLLFGSLIGSVAAVLIIGGNYYFTRSLQRTPEIRPSVSPSPTTLNKIVLDKTLSGHSDTVWSVAVRPNSQNILSGSSDRTIKLWDFSSGKLLRTFSRHSGTVWSVAVSPDGQSFASSSSDNTADVWDLTTGKFLCTLAGHSGIVWSTAFSPDSETLATGSDDRTIRLWSMTTGKEFRQLSGHSDAVRAIAFSPDGQYLVSGSSDTTIKVWDFRSGKVLRTLQGHSDRILTVAISPDNQLLVSGSVDKTIRIWQLSSGKLLRTLSGNPHWVNTVAISPDGNLLASGIGKKLEVWNLNTGEKRYIPFQEASDITSIFFSTDSKNIISSSRDNSIKILRL
ncbi:serine/threonine-protein kinase [Gloeocapsopsis sp. IPPAS B-1203]|uniref:serine/threonine-protein kinase n=1 Tax=Gloeocapsopsis sp. IPPAS B-1203 TaxID=2049454 RepID=UPI000C17CF15|nr:serine/threonine-protein kinase [Gloeocapsopsis sp. IPPAS B-1203]PIG91105.1 serine/threonine protein kinase [Gloeocapsopsis sp. IPPAS B-1203]